jgi:hypothetical protein
VRKGEAETFGDELLEVWSLDEIGRGELDDFEDLLQQLSARLPGTKVSRSTYVNRPEPRAMSGGHILVQSLHSIRPAHLTILLVHVVRTRSRIVADPDAEVLDLERSLLVDDIQGDDLAVRLLDLAELHEEVPEARLCHDGVRCKDAHAVQLWCWVGLGRQVPSDDLVFCEATWIVLC